MELRQLQLAPHASSTLDVYQKIKINELSPQDSSLVIKVQLLLCMQTDQIRRCASLILWEALLVKGRVAEVRRDRKELLGRKDTVVKMYVCMYVCM